MSNTDTPRFQLTKDAQGKTRVLAMFKPGESIPEGVETVTDGPELRDGLLNILCGSFGFTTESFRSFALVGQKDANGAFAR